MAELPALAPVPPPAVRSRIQHEDWDAFLDAWTMLVKIRLEASEQAFAQFTPNDGSAVSFLCSFFHELSASEGSPSRHSFDAGPKSKGLRKLSFLLTRRLLLEQPSTVPSELLGWGFLSDLSCCYPSSTTLRKLMIEVWNKHESTIVSSLENAKAAIIKSLSSSATSASAQAISDMRRLTVLASVLPACGQVLMVGSDFLDTLCEAYTTDPREVLRSIIVATIYVGLMTLLKEPKANLSLLLDQLFSLKASAGVGTPRANKNATLLSDLICSTDLLVRLEKYTSIHPQKRAQDLIASLRSYQSHSKELHHRHQRHRKPARHSDKGKGRAAADGPVIPEHLHAHKMSLITQIQDLFPDLGPGYVVRLLDFYQDNPEIVISHLLDDSLAPELQTLDRSEQLHAPINSVPHRDALLPQPTPPQIPSPPLNPTPASSRKNVFDKDVDLAELTRSSDGQAHGRLRFGRANPELTADAILADRSRHAVNKAAIISALATFDSDDDERDDTYDVADVGGTVDTGANADDADAERRTRQAEEHEVTLFRTYKANPALFARDSATRRGQPRASLKRETGMTDEAIEGWAVMLARDPKRLAKLEDHFTLGAGGAGAAAVQPDLPSTAYRKPGREEVDDDESDETGGTDGGAFSGRGGRGGQARGGGGRGRGRGGGRGGTGRGRGGTTGLSGEQSQTNTPLSHQRKEQHKASRANHNRRNQRAKKVARGGGLPG